jgi:hypothetical protein
MTCLLNINCGSCTKNTGFCSLCLELKLSFGIFVLFCISRSYTLLLMQDNIYKFLLTFVYGTYFAKVQQSNACRLIPQTHREHHIFMCVNGWVSTQLWMAATQPQCQQRSPHILTLYFPIFVDTKNLSLYRKILRGISYVCLLTTNNIHSSGKLGMCYFISYILHHVELKNM